MAAQAAQSRAARRKAEPETLRLGRNFLHAARLEFAHPLTGKPLQLEAPLPAELESFLERLESGPVRVETRTLDTANVAEDGAFARRQLLK